MPFCPLYQTSFREFPPKCPLAYREPGVRLELMLKQAWTLVGRETGSSIGLMGLRVVDTCSPCIGRLLGHPWIKHVRKRYTND